MLFNKIQYPFLGEGNPKAKILIVTEQPNAEESKSRKPIGNYKKEIFSRTAKLVGLKEDEFFFISCTDETLPIEHSTSEAKKKDHVIKHRGKLIQFIQEFKPAIIVPLGKSATTALAGRSVKLNTVRGMIQDYDFSA
jgi:uracil-DNA glycosylase family 4